MLGEHVDLVAGDFNGTACWCSNRNNISTIEEAFADCALPTPEKVSGLSPRKSRSGNPGETLACFVSTCCMSSNLCDGDDSRSFGFLETGLWTLARPRQVMLEGSVARFVAGDQGDSFRLRVDQRLWTCGDEEAHLGSKAEVASKACCSASRSASHGCGASA